MSTRPDPTEDKVLALAGIFQSARLAQRLARTNTVIDRPFAASIYSILMIDADTTADIFGDQTFLQPGLESVRDKLGGDTDPDDFEVARYVAGMIQLARKLQKDKELEQKLGRGLQLLAQQYPPQKEWLTTGELPDGLVTQLADLYSETLSTLTPRLVIHGEEGFLKREDTVARVRAVLMAGIRSAHLWWQLGGRRWQILFGRDKLASTARVILAGAQA